MADSEVSVKITAQTADAEQGMQRVRVSAQQFQEALKAAGGNADKALASIASIGTAGEAATKGLTAASGAVTQFGGKASGALRELTYLADEIIGGRFSRIPGSLSVMANRVGLLGAAFGALVSPIGAAVAAVGALAGAFALLMFRAAAAQKEINAAINTAALAQGTAAASAEFERFNTELTQSGVLGDKAGRTLAAALIQIPGLTDKARQGVADLAEAFTQYRAGGNAAEAAKELTQIFSSSGAIEKFVEENNLLSASQQKAWEMAEAHGPHQIADKATAALKRQEIAVEALTGRFAAYTSELKKAQDIQQQAAAAGAMYGLQPPSAAAFLPMQLKIPSPSQSVEQAAAQKDQLDALMHQMARSPSTKDPMGSLEQWTREVEAAYREAYRAEEQYATDAESRDRTMLRTFELNMQQMVKSKQITMAQALGFDLQYSAQLYQEDRARLEQIMADDKATVAEKQHVYDQLLALDERYKEKVAQINEQVAAQTNKSWTDAIKPIEDQFTTFVTTVIDGTKSIGAAFDSLVKSILNDMVSSALKSFMGSFLGTGTPGGSGILV